VHAARDLGHPCTVVVPHSTKPFMISKLRAAGATEVLQHGESWFEADTFLRETFIKGQPGNVYVPPFDHEDVWEGAGSLIEEIEAQLGGGEGEFPADVVVCSVGGGGLFNGVVGGLEKCLKKEKKGKDVCVVAVETEGADALAHSLREGKLSSLRAITSQATSLGALCVAEKAFENAVSPPKGVAVESIVGSDAEAARGVLRLADEMRLQVELACGISLEVAVNGRLKDVVPGLNPETKVVVVICGGSNISAEMIAEYREKLGQGWK
jgi:L-serine/L-threonine ammonia-lyase